MISKEKILTLRSLYSFELNNNENLTDEQRERYEALIRMCNRDLLKIYEEEAKESNRRVGVTLKK